MWRRPRDPGRSIAGGIDPAAVVAHLDEDPRAPVVAGAPAAAHHDARRAGVSHRVHDRLLDDAQHLEVVLRAHPRRGREVARLPLEPQSAVLRARARSGRAPRRARRRASGAPDRANRSRAACLRAPRARPAPRADPSLRPARPARAATRAGRPGRRASRAPAARAPRRAAWRARGRGGPRSCARARGASRPPAAPDRGSAPRCCAVPRRSGPPASTRRRAASAGRCRAAGTALPSPRGRTGSADRGPRRRARPIPWRGRAPPRRGARGARAAG